MEERRTFLKKSGLVVLGVAGISSSIQAEAKSNKHKWSMIIDLNRCTGCQSCVIACKGQNKTSAGFFNTKVFSIEDGNYPNVKISYTPVLCNQCENPPCVDACPVNATFKLGNGIVVTDWEKCESQGECVPACPYDARFLDPEHGNKVDKCDFCLTRLEKGLEPACVEACPSKARILGDILFPQGEFAEYVSQSNLSPPQPQKNTEPKVQYVVSRNG